MRIPRGLLAVMLLSALTMLIVTVRPAPAGGVVAPISISLATREQPTATSLPPTPSPTPWERELTATMPLVVNDPTVTPLAFYASQLQTPASHSTVVAPSQPDESWNPPPVEVPVAYHPFDHYWLTRPVDSNYNNFGSPYYPYGSDGPANDLRIHHGIDITNPIGVEVHAAASGTVIWADRGHRNEYEAITAYGNTVVIEHDFGYDGQAVYTLYAHLSVLLVERDRRVEAGDVIGLIGNTGQVTGPHVHFEVRVGRNSYFAVRNPVLWMAPYAGTGVVAGRVTLGNGEPVYDAPVFLIDVKTGETTHRTTTYAGFGINPDDKWGENFVLPDVPVGRYQVICRYGGTTWTGVVEVLPGVTNWVELERRSPTPAP